MTQTRIVNTKFFLNDKFDNSNDNSSKQVPIPPPVEHDEGIQDSCGTYVNVKDWSEYKISQHGDY